MITRRHIAIDLGASGGRVIEVRIGKGELRMIELHRFANAPVTAPHAGATLLHWPIQVIWDGILDGLRAAARGGGVDSIGIDSWAVDYALIDGHGELVRPIAAYRDPRTREPFARLRASLGDDEIYRRTGIAFQPFNTIYQLAADAVDPTRPLDRAERMLLLPDYIASRLCGAMVAERTNASTTQLLDARTRCWCPRLAAAAGAPMHLFPDLIDADSAEPLGGLLADIAKATGLAVGTPILAVNSHDTASAVLAAPIDPAHDLYISSGTWSLVGAELRDAVTSDDARTANLTNELGAFGSVRFLRNVAGLWLVQQLEAGFARAGRARSWPELVALAEAAEPLRSLVDPDDPRFFEPGDMAERLREACSGRGEPSPDSDGALVRCALDGVALATARAVEAITRAGGLSPSRIVIVGGGSANGFLNQLIADATGLPITTGPVECTAIGNALMQHAALEGIDSAAPLRTIIRTASGGDAPDRQPEPAMHARMQEAAARLL